MQWQIYTLIALGTSAAIAGLVALAVGIRMRPAMLATTGTILVLVVVALVTYALPQAPPPSSPRFQQSSGESAAGKNEATTGKSEGERAREITGTAEPLKLTDEQRRRISDALHNEPALDTVNMSLTVGAAVPRQIELRDLPTAVADALHGYNGDKYLLVRDQLVIVDGQARRVVALVPGVKEMPDAAR
jgi:uncharacterized protein DUF1236